MRDVKYNGTHENLLEITFSYAALEQKRILFQLFLPQ